MSQEEETIVAIATPIGQAGIGIVRISGPRSFKIARNIFTSRTPMGKPQSHRLYLGNILDPSTRQAIDEVLLSFMKAPHSYTREDVVEINSHSGYLILSKILQLVLDQGGRLARPGEFTHRAFLNGRIDLTQAEAVMDLINARSERGLHLASQQIRGSFRDEIEALCEGIIDILSHLEVAIDFPGEEEALLNKEDLAKRIESEAIKPIEILIKSHTDKRIWVDGIHTVIVGSANAGKSSLLNRLLDEPRAIVTPVSGTTRDIIESTVLIEGLPLCLVDTAGFREVKDEVEKIGIQLTEKKLEEADLLLIVIDQSRSLDDYDLGLLNNCRNKKALVVLNKIDLPCQIIQETLDRAIAGFPVVRISALTGQGIEHLRKTILDCILKSETDMTLSHSGPNLRHREALSEAGHCFKNAKKCFKQEVPVEIVALELRSGLDVLGEIIGETTNEDVLDRIFSQFCLGK